MAAELSLKRSSRLPYLPSIGAELPNCGDEFLGSSDPGVSYAGILEKGQDVTGHRRNGTADRVIWRVTAAALAITAASYLGGAFWLIELLTHFRLQFAAGAILLLAAAIIRRRTGLAAIAALVVAANSLPLLPYAMPGAAAAHAGEARLRVMAANVLYRSNDYERALAQIDAEDPDIVGLVEVTDAWIDALPELQQRFPYHVLRPEESAHGLALFSRLPLQELEISPYHEGDIQTAIHVLADLQGRQVVLTLAHLVSPVTPRRAALRNRQIEAIAELVNKDKEYDHVVIGDLNITPWSPDYAALEEAGLVNAARGRGYMATWPAGLGPAGLPIDHVLVSGGLHVQQFRMGASIGSDHLPIVADITFLATPVRSWDQE